MFQKGEKYSRNDIYEILKVPDHLREGNWNTGYTQYEGVIYIFANVGVPGRSGGNYPNRWAHGNLIWYTKRNDSSRKKLLDPSQPILLFTRNSNRQPFEFNGAVNSKSHQGSKPTEITWQIIDHTTIQGFAEEVFGNLFEGSYKEIRVNSYERSEIARRKCIDHYGAKCCVCEFDFAMYGDIGVGYIHVHHLVLLSQIKAEYEVDPIKDLRPVCPNCHAMIHRRYPEPFSIQEIKARLKK
jgi:5-methylcytosine-specific restriction protein A